MQFIYKKKPGKKKLIIFFFVLKGNKGGIGVSLKINEEMICFVNSHLAAHVQEIEQRRKDYEEINNRMEFWWDNKKKFIGQHE